MKQSLDRTKSNFSPLGIIGLGKMGRCLVQGLLESKTLDREQILFTTKHEETSEKVVNDLKIRQCKNNGMLVNESNTILLAVKPQNIEEVLSEIGGKINGKTLISIVASYSTARLESKVGEVPIIRAMPNTPALVREAMTAMCLGRYATDRDWDTAATLFTPVGQIARVDEKHMDAVTGLSGCGPAYIYVILESLTDAGIKVGLPRDLATKLAAQTVLGAARMLLNTGHHPASLKDEVTTPAGCTIDGLLELEEGKLRITLMKAVLKATERAKSLSQN